MSYQGHEPFESDNRPPARLPDSQPKTRRQVTPEEKQEAIRAKWREGAFITFIGCPAMFILMIWSLAEGATDRAQWLLFGFLFFVVAGPILLLSEGGAPWLHALLNNRERERERQHELALAEVKNRGIIEPHRLRGETEMYKADRDTEVSMKKIEVDLKTAANDFAAVGINASKDRDIKQLEVDGKIIELKNKLEATPQETRLSKAQEQLLVIEKIQAVRVAADAFKMRDDDTGKVIYVKGKPQFENADDQSAYEAQMETYRRLLKQIAG